MNELNNKPLWNFEYLRHRILNLAQRNRNSCLFGCCDRQYWGWKQRDFPDLTKQYSLYPYSRLMGNDPTERDWFRGMVLFLLRNLRPDGSADQCFPREASIGPTLYLMHALLSSYEQVLKCFDAAGIESVRKAILRSLNFAISHPEDYGKVANHKALYAHAYLMGHRLFGNERLLQAYVKEIHEVQSLFQEGWFMEYETADPGYQTQCLHYLTLCWQDRPDETLKKMILDSIEQFLVYFVFPDGSFSGTFGGRATECVYPYPLFFWSRESPAARELATYIFLTKNGKALPRWDALDDDNCLRIGTNFLCTAGIISEWQPAADFSHLPWANATRRYWPQAGLIAISDACKYMVINAKRGGIFKLVSADGAQSIDDTGYLLKFKDGSYVSSHFDDNALIDYNADQNVVRLEKVFTLWKEPVLDASRLVLLRLLAWTVLRFKTFSRLLKKQMVKALMRQQGKGCFRLCRSITAEGVRLKIQDTVSSTSSCPFSCSLTSSLIPFHMASAGYYHDSPRQLPEYAFSDLEAKESLVITTELFSENGKIRLKQERTMPKPIRES